MNDKNKSEDAQERFREISEAYEILTNTDKRRMYDNFGYDSISGDIPQINPLDLFQSLFNVDFTGLGENMHSNIFVFSDLSSSPFLNSNPVMKYNLECSLEDLYQGKYSLKKKNEDFHIFNTANNFMDEIKPILPNNMKFTKRESRLNLE